MFNIKKRKILFLILAVLILFTGCMRQSSTDLGWQKFPLKFSAAIEAYGRLADNTENHIEVTVTEPYCGSISFVSGGALDGYTFTLGKNGGEISYYDISIPMSERLATDMKHFLSLFALDTDHLTELSVQQHDGKTINVAVFSLFCGSQPSQDPPSESESNPVSTQTEADTGESDCPEQLQIGTVTVHLYDGIPILMDAEYSSGEHVVLKISDFKSQSE